MSGGTNYVANWKIKICACVGVLFGTWLATALEMFENEAGVWGLSVHHINGARTSKKTKHIFFGMVDA